MFQQNKATDSLLLLSDTSSGLPANVYRAALSPRHSLAKIQPAEAILSRIISVWTYKLKTALKTEAKQKTKE